MQFSVFGSKRPEALRTRTVTMQFGVFDSERLEVRRTDVYRGGVFSAILFSLVSVASLTATNITTEEFDEVVPALSQKTHSTDAGYEHPSTAAVSLVRFYLCGTGDFLPTSLPCAFLLLWTRLEEEEAETLPAEEELSAAGEENEFRVGPSITTTEAKDDTLVQGAWPDSSRISRKTFLYLRLLWEYAELRRNCAARARGVWAQLPERTPKSPRPPEEAPESLGNLQKKRPKARRPARTDDGSGWQSMTQDTAAS
jgi:hypothetical protein